MKKLRQMVLKRIPDSLYRQIKFLSIILLIVLLCTYIANIYYVASANARNVKILNSNKMEQLENEIEIYSENINNIASSLVYSSAAYDYFTMDEISRVINSDEITPLFLNAAMMEDDIKQICLYDAQMNLIAGSESVLPQGEKSFSDMEEGTMEFGDMFVSDYNGLSYYTIAFPVLNLSDKIYGNRVGMCLFIMRTTGLENMLEDMKVTDNSAMYLLDRNESVVASYGDDSGEYSRGLSEQTAVRPYVEECEMNENGWTLVSVIPWKEVNFGTLGLYVNITLVYLLLAALLIALMTFFRKWIVNPLEQIDRFIENVLAEPDVRMETERKDEIGMVINSLNRMLDEKEILQNNIQNSQKKMHEMELAKKRIQILAYRNQINPHFLYNTLGCIRAMALYYDAEEISEISLSLSDLFRYAVKGNNVVLVEEEISYIEEYARIIGYRFGGKIRIHIQAEEAVKKKKVIKLLLQPLVENAVFHGVEQKLDGGDVFVNAYLTAEGFIGFSVEDNGRGMTKQRKKEVLEMLEQEEDEENVERIGLLNIYKRLKLFYGESVGFMIESIPETGTKVIITVPEQIRGEKDV